MTSHHQRRMLQLPVMRDLVARHLWAGRTISPLRRGVCWYSQLGLAFLHLPSNPCGVLHCCLPCRSSAMHYGLMCRALMSQHLGAPEWPPVSTVWRPLPVVGKPDLTASS